VENEHREKEYFEQLRQAWRKRARQEKESEERRRREALAKARAIARYLKEKYNVNAVYLYGSLAWGRHFTSRSDIDLLVEGFPEASSYWRMLVEVEDIASPFEVNVVLSEDANFSLRKKAKKEGKLL